MQLHRAPARQLMVHRVEIAVLIGEQVLHILLHIGAGKLVQHVTLEFGEPRVRVGGVLEDGVEEHWPVADGGTAFWVFLLLDVDLPGGWDGIVNQRLDGGPKELSVEQLGILPLEALRGWKREEERKGRELVDDID